MKTMFSALPMKVELGEGADLAAVHSRLLGEGKGFEAPLLGKPRSLDAPLQALLLPGVPLGPQEPEQEVRVRHILLLGGLEVAIVDLEDAFQVQAAEQLLHLFGHSSPPVSSPPLRRK